MTIVTKAALAQTLDVSKARISQYCRRGMPVRADGMIDLQPALKWIGENHTPVNGTRKGAGRAADLASRAKPKRRQTSPDTVDMPSFDKGALWMGAELVYRVGGLAASLAVAAGAPMRVAYALEAALAVAMFAEMDIIAAETETIGQVELDPESFRQPDWPALARMASEPVDIAAWEAHAAARFGEAR